MNRDAPAFARYIALVAFLQTPVPAAVSEPKARAPRRAYTEAQKQLFAQLRDKGVPIGRAARQMDVPLGTVKFWEECKKGNR